MPGLVALVSRHDDVQAETLGTMAFGHPAPMKRDAIFRIASITKPITVVAAMILIEECRLRLDESMVVNQSSDCSKEVVVKYRHLSGG
jgi:CubicO group peptidase (beta-lactamase class C family)